MAEGKGFASALCKGRWSSPGHIYLVTTVTRNRERVFSGFAAARSLIRVLRDEAGRGSHVTLAYVVMPDHLHWLLQLGGNDSLSVLVGRVKSLSARRIGRSIWQAGFHDRALRQEEHLQAVARYVVANPIRAGLVPRAGLYSHWDAVWL
ncbi:transposase [Pseudomonas cavernicola]|uniref:Transposase n=1 Tax=Pseudomonas cavernicola TaxID=2320866 RepID=A0A418XA27_9PSED|nr:transposase [Pseudomonas cavernicola]RJG09218.1 transposase [Pseudomonas cavernicola]